MNRHIVILSALLAAFSTTTFPASLNFQFEADRATKAIGCKSPKVTPGGDGLGALYGCITGAAQTVKFFINESAGTGQVKNVKLMWNDWFTDAGQGVHADKEEAQAFLGAFGKLYAPEDEQKLSEIFFSNSNASFESDSYRIAYTYKRGPKIDERLLILTPK